MADHKKHDARDLVDALEHVVYEIWKYKQSVVHYAEISAAGGDAAIEFRVLHHRILLEFFHGLPKHPDNIFAWEYIDNWRETHDSSSMKWLGDYMKRCHTMLAHISKSRSDIAKSGRKGWGRDWPVVEPHLDRAIAAFLGGLSIDHKNTCLEWINRWSQGRFPGNDVLTAVVTLVNPR